MPTVPNWIAKAVVITRDRGSDRVAYPVKSWRATKTQVIVTIDAPNRAEARFYLDGLVGVGADRGAELVDPEVAKDRLARIRSNQAVSDLETAMVLARLDRVRSDPEALVTEIGKIQRAATKALAALADVL